MNRINTLYNTVVVNQKCDLSCSYCDTRNHPFISNLDSIQNKESEFIRTITRYNELFSAEILELIGGGEIFLEKNIPGWIEPFVKEYDHLEIVTNGVNLPIDDILKINSMLSFSLAVSVDGHTYEMCRSRFPTESIFTRVWENIMTLMDNGVYLRLRTVLNPANVNHMEEYLEFLAPYKGKISLCITPVKDKIPALTHRQDFNREYLDCVDYILENHDKYKEFIGPYGYFLELRNYFLQKGKQMQCFIPYVKTLTLIDGRRTACSVNWIRELPNIHTVESSEELFSHDIFKLMNRKTPVISACKEDFGDCDMFNMYMHDFIKLEDFSYFRPYTRPRIMDKIQTLKKELMPKMYVAHTVEKLVH